MDDLQSQVKQLETTWSTVYEAIKGTPATYAPYLPGASAEQIDEAVRTVVNWMDRVRAPRGFAPVFHVAKGLASTALPAALNSVQALARGEYGHFPNFLAALNQLLSALHSMLSFSDDSESRDVIASLGGKLAEAISLLDTAQKELRRKSERLAEATKAAETLEAEAERSGELVGNAETALAAIVKHREEADTQLEEIGEEHEKASARRAELEALVAAAKELESSLNARRQQLSTLADKATAQTVLIADLLPKGASAGLASAFAHRVSQLEHTKWIWMGVFIASVGGLVWMAFNIVDIPFDSTQELWREVIHRLPLAAPLVWLGWFSAIQYGNSLRVQEDYAFKEATSKAFAGYRDHMEHMASVQLNEANSAMLMLAEKTIEILAREPLRIFQGSDRDATPSHSLIDSLLRRRSGRAETGTE